MSATPKSTPPREPPLEKRRVKTLDVRPLFVAGIEPLPSIVAALSELGPGDRLQLISPFLPSPLIERTQAEGFEARPERRTDGSWATLFMREKTGAQ